MRFEERKWFWARRERLPEICLGKELLFIFLDSPTHMNISWRYWQTGEPIFYYFFFQITTGSNLSLELEPKRIKTFSLKTYSVFICVTLHRCLLLLANTLGHPDEGSTGSRVACPTEVISQILCPVHLRGPGNMIPGELSIFLNCQM